MRGVAIDANGGARGTDLQQARGKLATPAA